MLTNDDTEFSNNTCAVAPSPRDIIDKTLYAPVLYQKLPYSHTSYLAYVVAIRDPLNFHLDIYWPENIAERYSSALKYEYTFVSEELDPVINVRSTYSCHLRGVEIISTLSSETQPNIDIHTSNMKEAYIIISKRIL